MRVYKLWLTVCLLGAGLSALACTTFCLRGEGVDILAKNYDWDVADGHVTVNPMGLARTALLTGEGKPMEWTAKYGSLTFNQYGRDFPNGGMNTAGLAIEVLWLEESQYPTPDDRPVLEDLQWIQYQLDVAQNVEEVLASDKLLRIQSRAPVHFFVADRHGNAASVEFLQGKMIVHTGEKLPHQVLTNHTYHNSLNFVKKRGLGNNEDQKNQSSLARFARAANRTTHFKAEKDPINYAFKTLEASAMGSYTKWQIVYNLAESRVHFRTRKRPNIRSINFSDLDFSCQAPVLYLDLSKSLKGDVGSKLQPWTQAKNRELIERAFNKTDFLKQVSAEERDYIAAWPTRSACR